MQLWDKADRRTPNPPRARQVPSSAHDDLFNSLLGALVKLVCLPSAAIVN